jgi:hypothetical protein
MSITNSTAFSSRRSKSNDESISVMSTISTFDTLPDYDDTLPLPAEVEREFLEHAGGDVNAWFAKHDIDIAAAPIGKLIQYGMVWNPTTGRYQFLIYEPDHIGPKHPPELAIPMFEDGKFIDLLFISNDGVSFARATCRAPWLGTIAPTTRLHSHPMDWLEAGCVGACHVEPISRKALKDLHTATTIKCNDIHTALEAWDWGFGGEDEELARFVIDDTPGNISAYYEDDFKWRSASKESRYES